MLKWTASAQKLMQESSTAAAAVVSLRTPLQQRRTRQQRRATIATNINKENLIPNMGLGMGIGTASYVTSTPMVVGRSSLGQRTRNSPLVLAPLADIRNVTPEVTNTTRTRTPLSNQAEPQHQRVTSEHVYATTLPRFEDEEYSPSATVLPSGQHLALRGLLPMPITLPFQLDPFMGNPRYFNTPDMTESKVKKRVLTKKRKLDQEFAAIVMQEQQEQSLKKQAKRREVLITTPTTTATRTTCFNSSKMGDQTLDRLIDAILDSACKEEKKQKKSRKSFNLRRRTLLKNQNQITLNEHILSPSYTAGDDPASDLSFLLYDPNLLTTPEPATPLLGTPLPLNVLTQMPTPYPKHSPRVLKADNTFTLATPVRPLAKKRRRCPSRKPSFSQITNEEAVSGTDLPVKKYKVDTSNYFEIGLALPSIYV